MGSKRLDRGNESSGAHDASHGVLEPCTASGGMSPSGKDQENRQTVVMEALEGGAGPISAPGLQKPIDVVSTTINTRGVGYTNPMVHFTGNIRVPKAMDIALYFHIVRSSFKSGTSTIGPTYVFRQIATARGSESFSFQLMDSERSPGIYTYTVELGTDTVVSEDGVRVTEAVLSVIAVRNSGDASNCRYS